MSLTIVNRRGRALVSLTAALGIALGAATIGTSPAQSVAPTPECTPYPGTPTKGDAVTALSVTSGTTPQHFTGKVLGVLQDGIAPDVDMVMVNINAPDPATMEVVAGPFFNAEPSSPATAAAWREISSQILDGLRSAMPVDIVFLCLHGAQMARAWARGGNT